MKYYTYYWYVHSKPETTHGCGHRYLHNKALFSENADDLGNVCPYLAPPYFWRRGTFSSTPRVE